MKAVRVPEEYTSPTKFRSRPPSGIMGEVQPEENQVQSPTEAAAPNTEHMRVLVAEDDPVNSKIVKKRMEKLGHEVYLTVNGEECAAAYGDKPGHFDVVLMDMQVSKLVLVRVPY